MAQDLNSSKYMIIKLGERFSFRKISPQNTRKVDLFNRFRCTAVCDLSIFYLIALLNLVHVAMTVNLD